MRIIEPHVKNLGKLVPKEDLYEKVAQAGRICYQSEPNSPDEDFIRKLIKRGHESVLEHASISLIFVCDRGVTHELVRHRVASYSQESTRYCNYSDGRFNAEITVIEPLQFKRGTPVYRMWKHSCEMAEVAYFDLLNEGCSPQEARAVLPNSLKTEIAVTMNIREWRHFLNLRYFGTTGAPHPQMKEVAGMAYKFLMAYYPAFFEDLG